MSNTQRLQLIDCFIEFLRNNGKFTQLFHIRIEFYDVAESLLHVHEIVCFWSIVRRQCREFTCNIFDESDDQHARPEHKTNEWRNIVNNTKGAGSLRKHSNKKPKWRLPIEGQPFSSKWTKQKKWGALEFDSFPCATLRK